MRVLIAVAGAAALNAVAGADLTVYAQAVGSNAPPQVFDQDIQNGDFLILANPEVDVMTGDGIDETTVWDFNVQSDSDYSAFITAGQPITAATLTLTLTQFYARGPVTDLVRPRDLFPNIIMPEFLDAGETGTISFNLLDYYTSAQLMGHLTSNSGLFPMIYADDAIVSFASIEMTVVPAPATIAGALGLLAFRRRR